MPDGLAEAVASAGPDVARAEGPQAVAAAQDAFIGAFNELLLIAGLLAFAGALLGLLLTRQSDILVPGAPPAADVAPAGAAPPA